MSNSTNSTTVQFLNKFEQEHWIIAVTINGVCLVFLTWMTFTLVLYGIRTGKWRTDDQSNSFQASNAGWVYTTAVAAMVSGYLRFCADQAGFSVGFAPGSQPACQSALQASSVGYISTLCLVYIFLWLRQRAFYHHPLLAQKYNNKLKAVSWISITVILTGLMLTLVLYVAFNQFVSSKRGCELKIQNDATQWPAYMTTAFTAIGQLLMLFLFAYPLFHSKNAGRIKRLLQRSGIMVMVCMITDAGAVAYLKAPPAAHLPWMFYSVNMFVNLVAVYLSFETWTDIFLSPFQPCCGRRSDEMQKDWVAPVSKTVSV